MSGYNDSGRELCVSVAGLFLRLQNLAYILAEVYGSRSGPTDGGVKLPDMNSLRRALKVTL